MPKVIENLKDRILQVSREELFKCGYKSLNMRTIAKLCGIATGTLYNYFESKEVLVGDIVSEDWIVILQNAKKQIANAESVMDGIECIYTNLFDFTNLYRFIFNDSSVSRNQIFYTQRHHMLVNIISEMIKDLMDNKNKKYDEFEITFIASSIINGCNEQWTYNQVSGIYERILKGEQDE
ncbi:MAG: TetR/AcrR family transcriptional regulator [Holdemanella sp.]|nr:TetR/AcrR family transcriptional regulator [Holdemanella sp.]